MRKVMLVAGLVVGVLAAAVPAGAQATEIVIELDGVERGDEGEVIELVNRPVEADLVGAECSVSGRTENNESVHPGNDLIIQTGDSTTEVPDVEAQEFEVIQGTGSVTLGESIAVSLRFGPDGVTSGGIFLDFVCQAAAPEEAPDTGAGGTAGTDGTTPWVAIAVVGAAVGGGALMLGRRRLSDQG